MFRVRKNERRLWLRVPKNERRLWLRLENELRLLLSVRKI